MIKTRLYLANSEARKINCSYTYSAQEGSTETHTRLPLQRLERCSFSRGTSMHRCHFPFSLLEGTFLFFFFFKALISSCH